MKTAIVFAVVVAFSVISCVDACGCPFLVRLGCGTDGKSYSYMCNFAKNCTFSWRGLPEGVNITDNWDCLQHPRADETEEVRCFCPMIVKLGCGSDGKTYHSSCDVENGCGLIYRFPQGVHLAHEGQCTPHEEVVEEEVVEEDMMCACPRFIAAICGTDGKTYTNTCDVRHQCKTVYNMPEGVTMDHRGACEEAQPDVAPRCFCPRFVAPVCGTDGNTYTNTCDQRNNCQTVYNFPNGVTLDHRGVCEEAQPDIASCFCPRFVAPVCGTDGNTYTNTCDQRNHCKTVYNFPNGVTMDHRGACEEAQPDIVGCFCPQFVAPVCGTDGNTYRNSCDVKNHCQTVYNLPTGVTIDHRGKC